jgi:peptidyl-prolyl cis-trans isomerase B (cyclophilin B)
MQEDSSNLDGQYAAFGKVTSGMEVVDAICDDTPVEDSNGTVAKDNQPVITSIKMVD